MLLCTTLAGRAQQAYADHSVLADGRFVKVQVTENGLYRLPYADLRAKGIDPANVRLFGYGGAVQDEDFSRPWHDDLPEVAVYDVIPLCYELDGTRMDDPVGRKGNELRGTYHIIVGNASIREELGRVFERTAAIKPYDYMPLGV